MSIEPTVRRNIKAVTQAYRRATGRSLTSVSKQVYGNVNFLKQFFKGEQSITLPKADKIMGIFRAKWPDNAEWPYLDSIIFDPPQRRRRSKVGRTIPTPLVK